MDLVLIWKRLFKVTGAVQNVLSHTSLLCGFSSLFVLEAWVEKSRPDICCSAVLLLLNNLDTRATVTDKGLRGLGMLLLHWSNCWLVFVLDLVHTSEVGGGLMCEGLLCLHQDMLKASVRKPSPQLHM